MNLTYLKVGKQGFPMVWCEFQTIFVKESIEKDSKQHVLYNIWYRYLVQLMWMLYTQHVDVKNVNLTYMKVCKQGFLMVLYEFETIFIKESIERYSQ